MTATERFIADLRAKCESTPPLRFHPVVHRDTLRLLLDVVEKAPKPEPCDRFDEDKEDICGVPATHTEDILDWGRTWRCDKHWHSYDTEDPIGMAVLALEAYLGEAKA